MDSQRKLNQSIRKQSCICTSSTTIPLPCTLCPPVSMGGRSGISPGFLRIFLLVNNFQQDTRCALALMLQAFGFAPLKLQLNRPVFNRLFGVENTAPPGTHPHMLCFQHVEPVENLAECRAPLFGWLDYTAGFCFLVLILRCCCLIQSRRSRGARWSF